MISAYPLTWPEGWPRTKQKDYKHGRFATKKTLPGRSWSSTVGLTITEGTSRVLSVLAKMGIDRQDVVISTNVRTRLDGLPRSGEREPDDSGAAVYWETRTGERRVMAIDQYWLVADNLAAIAATLDAMRAIERHGGAQILDRAFTGFTALPAPTGKRTWREVFGFEPNSVMTRETLTQTYRRLASSRHSDKGGSDEAMSELNVAYEEAKQEIGQ